MSKPRVFSVLILAVGLVLTGCTGQDQREEADGSPGAVGGAPGTGDAGNAEDGSVDRSNEDALMLAWLTNRADCLTEAGFPSTVQPDGGIKLPPVPAEQQQAFDQADGVCDTKQGPAPNDAPYTTAELGALYDLSLDSLDCLTAAGYTVTEPPSRETFVAQYIALGNGSDEELPWSPWADFYDPTSSEKCPQPTGQDVAERLAGQGK